VRERVFLHPASFLFSVGEFRSPFLVFHEKAATSRTYIRDASAATPFAMILFGGALTVLHREGRVCVGDLGRGGSGAGFVSFRAEPRVGVLAKGLRRALQHLLAEKISRPRLDISASEVCAAIVRLLTTNGS
jgi:ATP-dependent RNA helicase DHX57